MGKSVPKGIKSKANIILAEMPQSFTEKFESNKKIINELKLPFSKWTTNVMSGFITRTKKNTRIALEKKAEAKAKRDVAMKAAPDMMAPKPHARTKKMEEKPTEAPAIPASE